MVKIDDLIKIIFVSIFVRKFTIGNRSTSSISKTKKITVRRKKRVENGTRGLFSTEKPHSKGRNFSKFTIW
jgi:hypothetical protein